MSKENLEQFLNQVAGSEELQAKIGEEIDAESLIALGAECGCEFTADELLESAELSDEELDGVAGGRTSPKYRKYGKRLSKGIMLKERKGRGRLRRTFNIAVEEIGCHGQVPTSADGPGDYQGPVLNGSTFRYDVVTQQTMTEESTEMKRV